MKNVYVALANGFEEIEAITILDVLKRAELNVTSISVMGSLKVEGAHGIKVEADKLIEDVNFDEADMIVLPGGMPGADNLENNEQLTKQLEIFNESNKKVAAICAAPKVLGKLGILRGRNAVCYPGFESNLKDANLKDVPAIKDANIITGRGPGAAFNFSLTIVEELINKEKANELAQAMLVNTWN